MMEKRKRVFTGDYVHVHRWEGLYRVHGVRSGAFCVMKNRDKVWLPSKEYRCHKGEGADMRSVLKREIKRKINDLEMLLRIIESGANGHLRTKQKEKNGKKGF